MSLKRQNCQLCRADRSITNILGGLGPVFSRTKAVSFCRIVTINFLLGLFDVLNFQIDLSYATRPMVQVLS